MINKVIILGRICTDIEMRKTETGTPVAAFTVAVDRPTTEKSADFIRCVAWNKKATFVDNFFTKGRMIAVEGNLRTRTYDDKNGTKHYVTEVYADNVSFTGEKPTDISEKLPAGVNEANTGYNNVYR